MKEDGDFKATADSALLEICDKKLTTLDAVINGFKNREDELKFQDLATSMHELDGPHGRHSTTSL
jgi:hypothetical protein